MDPKTFATADPLVDQTADLVDSALLSEQLASLRQALTELDRAIGPRYSVSLSMIVDVLDRQRERRCRC